MSEQVLQVHVSPEKKFVVVCPSCSYTKNYHLDDLTPNSPNPFKFDCQCGRAYMVFINFRKAHRKSVNLVGSFTISSDPRKTPRLCTVLDLSTTGMRLSTEFIKNLQKGEVLHTTFILDDKPRTKLTLVAIIRQIFPAKGQILLGLEFVNMDAHQNQVLGYYMMG